MAGRKPNKPQRFLKRKEPSSPSSSGGFLRDAVQQDRAGKPRPENFDLLLQAGLDAHRAGNLAEAKRQYELVVAARPADHRSRQLLGIVLHQLGHHQAAERLLREAIGMAGDVPEYHANLGAVLLNLQRHREALASLEQAKQLGPVQFETLFNMAEVCRRLGMFVRAEELLIEALRLRPDAPEALNELGMLKYTQQKLDDASACFERILQQHPQHTDALNNLGIITQCRGRVREAMALYDQAIAVRPDFADRKSTRLNSSHVALSRMPSSA